MITCKWNKQTTVYSSKAAPEVDWPGSLVGARHARDAKMVGVPVANANTPIEGHFFSVISNTNEVILSIEPIFASNSPDERYRAPFDCTGRWRACSLTSVSELHGITMGQRVGTDADGTARYHFCLLYSGSMPMLLSTHTDDERREEGVQHRIKRIKPLCSLSHIRVLSLLSSQVATAIAAAQAGKLLPSAPVDRSALLQREHSFAAHGGYHSTDPCIAVLCGRRLLLFATTAKEGPPLQPKGRPTDVLTISGLAEEIVCADEPKFLVRHVCGTVTFVAANTKERALWIEALSAASCPGWRRHVRAGRRAISRRT